ncbi:CYCLIC NUCLEOTIDE-GATED ION CHANNEL 15-RELATED-RELATED [Salix purpurea]|uniref:CYCLIC NUCLEOTIDE-GATED ION CHANNEL 15-RELATED-RELATED n=1 Tax=Salix purpurea TaxID=77065 RepID=A0A9Q0PEF2_SALPP|nr:CYCLIC NUCLEOTIDE-GATED ION CHANNEL 15-RELATED-RELATED [Salix purpurea]
MNHRGDKFVRFQDCSSEKSFSSEQRYSIEDGFYARKAKPTFNAVWDNIRRGWEMGSERIRSLKNPSRFNPRGARSVKEQGPKKKILDPQGSFLQIWNKIFMLVCVLAVAIDPLFFYIPWIKVTEKDKCLDLDHKMEAAACALRTFIDVVYILRIVFQFRTGFIAPSSRVFGRGELVEDPKAIAKKYFTSYFIVDILSILPLPQAVLTIILPSVVGPVSLAAKNLLELVIFAQYIPRLVRIYPLFKEITSTSGILTETAWAGAVFNLFLYMLASHIIGAFWYLFSIEREDSCWREACKGHGRCDSLYWYCGNHRRENHTFLTESCPFIHPDQIQNSTVFNFGIFIDALDSGVVESTYFPRKFFYCFWWGLRNLSSLGQNLKTSAFIGENLFAVFISIAGLVLFALLIGNMQKYLESTTIRIEEMRVKRRDAEQWMSHRMLPDNLRERIRRYEQYKWQETRGVEERGLIRNLPKDLRRDINRHLCLDLIKKVPIFEKMDERILDAVCDRLKATLYTKG